MSEKKSSAAVTLIKSLVKAIIFIFLAIVVIVAGMGVFDADSTWGTRAFFAAIVLIIGFGYYKFVGKSKDTSGTGNGKPSYAPNALSDYRRWRDVIFAVTSGQVDVSTDKPNQVYGVIMDVGLSDDFIITITAFPTGESSLRTTIGGGTIGLGGDEFVTERAKHIVMLAQYLIEKATRINNHNLPKSQKVYFYFLTTSGLMLSEASVKETSAQNHPLHEMFGQFTKIKARSEELTKTYKR